MEVKRVSRFRSSSRDLPAHRGDPRQPPHTHNSIIHSPSSNSFQFSSVMMRTSLRRPWVQGAPQANSSNTATGTTGLLEAVISAARPPHSKRSAPHLCAAAPHFRPQRANLLMRMTAQLRARARAFLGNSQCAGRCPVLLVCREGKEPIPSAHDRKAVSSLRRASPRIVRKEKSKQGAWCREWGGATERPGLNIVSPFGAK